MLDAGAGDLWELRSTDIDIAKCRRRYEVFKVRPAWRSCPDYVIMPCRCALPQEPDVAAARTRHILLHPACIFPQQTRTSAGRHASA